jgi:fibronectin-binding autotransporter adhesin
MHLAFLGGVRGKLATLSTSTALGICCLAPGVAAAQCVFQPLPAFQTTTCTSSNPQTVIADVQGSTLNIQPGASVGAVYATSVPVVPDSGPYYPQTTYLTVNDNGQITNGVTVDSGPVVSGAVYGPNTNLTLTVGSGGSIGGSTAITLIPESGNGLNGTVALTLDNQGTIQSTSGPAITANGSANAVVTSLTNAAGATIGGIQAVVLSLTNAGTINGGSGSAIDTTTSSSTFQQMTWQNSGTITSSNTLSTLNIASTTPLTLTNSGQIANTGSGSAITLAVSSPYYITSIDNTAGATISSAGGTAIASSATLSITNAGTISGNGDAINTFGTLLLASTGTINGSVVADNVTGSGGSRIDLSGGGVINGSLTLGASNGSVGNSLTVDYSGGTNVLSSITGTVSIGGTNNALTLAVANGATLNSAITLPGDFSTLALDLAEGSTVTLGSGFSTPIGLTLYSASSSAGSGATLVNQANISTTGPALIEASPNSLVTINNAGTITANMTGLYTGSYAVTAQLDSGGTVLINSGTITATGGNAVSALGSVVNSGTITADATALAITEGVLTNSGTISGGTVGANLTGVSATNTGTISGGQIGVEMNSASLINSGTITASGGLGVFVTFENTLTNQQGGVIDNGIGVNAGNLGVTFANTIVNNGTINGGINLASITSLSNVVSNSGTINGDVNLGEFSYGASGNTYVALAGSVLNGNLDLGSGGDTLAIVLGSNASAEITGTITGSGSERLLTLVTADASATLSSIDAPNALFSVFGYDLANNATLTLTAPGNQVTGYTFAGTGTVNLTANIVGTGTSALLDLTGTSIQTDASGTTVPTVLNFTSNGNLTVTGTSGVQSASAVVLGTGSTFTNNGTITYNSANPLFSFASAPTAAIQSTGSVINNGTIAVAGGAAIAGAYAQASSVINTGSIVQIAGADNAIGLFDVSTVVNSGTIATAGRAVAFNAFTVNTLVNSGTISSSAGVAIAPDGLTPGITALAQITNSAGGVITSTDPDYAAILLGGGSSVTNSGTINGDVLLGTINNGINAGSTYVSDGGTLNGNLAFGGNNNTLVIIGASSGITGTISTGGGTGNLFAQGYTSSASVDLSTQALPVGFQTYGLGAIGADTALTISGPSAGLNTGLTLFGDGTVINTATINSANGANVVTLGGALDTLLGVTGGITFVNSGTLGDGLQGTAQSVTNSGTIGTQQNGAGVLLTEANASSFTFANSGQVWGSVALGENSAATTIPDQVTIDNSGAISGSLTGTLAATQLTLTNSGTVNGIDIALDPSQAPSSNDLVSVTNTGSGVVTSGFTISAASHDLAFSNAGQIGQYLFLTQSTGTTDAASATIANSGTISGLVGLYLGATNVSLTNTGTIASTLLYGYNYGGLTLTDTTVGNGTVAFTNSGTISTTALAENGALISVTAGSTSAPATASVTVTNTGSISANGGGAVYVTDDPVQYFSTGLAVSANAPGGTSSIAITNAAGATISATGPENTYVPGAGFITLPPGVANLGSIALIASAQTVTVTNAGTINGASDTTYVAADNVALSINGISLPTGLTTTAGAVDLIGTTVSLTNTGTINGDSLLYSQDATFANYGTVNGKVTLGDGSGLGTATAIEGINATLTGTVTGTAATNTLEIDVTGGGTISQALLNQIQSQFVGFSAASLTGSGTVSFSGPLSVQTLVLNNASLTLAAGQTLQTAGGVALTGGSGTNSFTNYGTVNGAIVDIDTTNAAGGVINVATTATSDATLTNAAGAQFNVNSGTFTIDGLVTNGGAITVADGAALDAIGGISNSLGGTITVQTGGAITDTLINAGTVVINGTYNADIENQAGGTITVSGTVTAPDAILNAGTFTGNGAAVSTPEFANQTGGVLAGTVAFTTPGGTVLTNQGTISGKVTFGAGSNELVLESGSQITGTVTGGSGTNLLAIVSSATDAAPDQYNLGGITGFQQSELVSGSVALSGSYTTGNFEVLGGHLIGNAGSVLNAATITVANGAVFGSAGTVNGAIAVSGTLAPIGTMTVNGGVTFNSGSTALFAGTSTQPQLAVTGKVTVANGAVLTLSSAPSTRQGTLVQLISASGGISGSFAVSGLSSSYDVVDTGTVLEIYRPFIAGAGFGNGATSAVAAVNALVVSGQANAAQLADLTLLDNAQGTASAGKFARLTPEPYATATQIGIDNGLLIADTLRDFDYDSVASPLRGNGHAFTFAEALGNWSHAGGNIATGASAATNSAEGILGGVGLRGSNGMIGAFAGGLHDQQAIATLGSTTSAHSTLFGANALAWYNGTGGTTRALPDGTSTYGSYGLRAMIADATVGYTIHDVAGWMMRPQVGLTHITVHRDAASEENSSAFALDVQGERRRLDFIDGTWRLAPAPTATSTFMPWISMGFRVRLNGDQPQAAAFLPGSSDAIVADGVLRARTAVTFKAGFSYALTPGASLYATFDGERGSGSNTVGGNGGIRIAF